MKKLHTILMAVLCCIGQFAIAQMDVIGSEEYGRLFNITYDPLTPDKVYATPLGNHIVVSEDNGDQWEVLYSFPESTTTIEGLRFIDEEKLSFYTKNSGVSGSQRSVFVLDVNSLEIVDQYTTPVPDASSERSWVSSYSIYEENPDVALVDLSFKIGLDNYTKV